MIDVAEGPQGGGARVPIVTVQLIRNVVWSITVRCSAIKYEPMLYRTTIKKRNGLQPCIAPRSSVLQFSALKYDVL